MCGITGFYTQEAAAKAREALITMQCRGREAAGLYDGTLSITATPDQLAYSGSTFALGHVLHAMVGCVPQPIIGKGVLVTNCEIYNWRELSKQEELGVENDATLLLALLDRYYPDIEHILTLLDGVYAFAYQRDDTVILCRDIVGIKPLFFTTRQGFGFASEQKALTNSQELNPRTILRYNTSTKEVTQEQRAFFSVTPEHTESYEEQRDTVLALVRRAVEKRIPDTTFGILLSGGVDSSTLALLLRERKPRCYVVGTGDSADVLAAQQLATNLNLQLTIISPSPEDIEAALPLIMQTIEDCNPVKVSVATTFWFACAIAQTDRCRVLFSGLGAEEVFAGYERHRKSTKVNNECLSGLRKIHERDLYRDDVITMYHGIELRLPFLDRTLVEYGLKIPSVYKLTDKNTTKKTIEEVDKKILRDAAALLGVPLEHAYRKKKAAQYGSKIMATLEKLAKRRKQSIAAYLSTLYGRKNKRLASLLSTGKDSVLALHIMHDMRYEISCCITIESENPDSFMYHTPNVHLAALQATAMRVPLITAKTSGEQESELDALRIALTEAKERYTIEGVITGALASQYQRERIERIADSLGLTVFSPLWQMDQEHEVRLLIERGFHIILTKVAAEGLDSTWLGKRVDEAMVERLVSLRNSIGLHPAGEGGEYESLVLDAPLFKEKIVLGETESIKDGSAATLVIKHAMLAEK